MVVVGCTTELGGGGQVAVVVTQHSWGEEARWL